MMLTAKDTCALGVFFLALGVRSSSGQDEIFVPAAHCDTCSCLDARGFDYGCTAPPKFDSFTFSSCGTSGPAGPTSTACETEYSGKAGWDLVSPTFTVSEGIQQWTVPQTGTYTIKAVGASTPKQMYGSDSATPRKFGGRAAIMEASFSLTEGEKLNLLVGQVPEQTEFHGGGGGTFVVLGADDLLIAAGGGGSFRTGGTEYNPPGPTYMDASLTIDGKGCFDDSDAGYPSCVNAGGKGGNGGEGDGAGGGGAGWLTDEQPRITKDRTGGRAILNDAKKFLNGGEGARFDTQYSTTQHNGGFGGGGHGAWGGAGGGGGYSGGAGANNNQFAMGGGGGSFIKPTRVAQLTTELTPPDTPGHGYVTITAEGKTPAAPPVQPSFPELPSGWSA